MASLMRLVTWICAGLLAHSYFVFAAITTPLPDLYETSLTELQAGLTSGQFSSVDLIKAYFARIDEVNFQGPVLRAVIETNPSALDEAAALDYERLLYGPRSALHGIPVLVKDNIGTVAFEGMNTTAGSYTLLKSIIPEDSGVVKRLRQAGAIILGKANLSEWAHFRGNLASGWSGRGGQCTNAYYPNGDPCGSSSGSAVSSSIGLTAVALGTETDGSITCPANQNNIVGIKPTVGLTSRAGVVPISEHQDTVGPLTRSVSDAAIVLSIIAGPDPNDNFTLAQPTPVPDYTMALSNSSLVGKRIGVPRAVFLNDSMSGNDPYVNVVFEQALETLKELGATIIDPADLPSAYDIYNSKNETVVLTTDFKIQLDAWFNSLIANPSGVASLADVITFDNINPTLEEPAGYTGQSTLIASEATTGFNASYYQSLAFDKELGATNGIDAALKMYSLDALVLPAPGFTTVPAAIAGYPIVTVPLGFYPDNVTIGSAGPNTVYPAPGMPIGLSFFSTAWSEYELIGFGYAYEQCTQTRLQRLAYPAAIPTTQLADVIGSGSS
ncbi:amidase signature enzyme [Butyriboletus roseoflavus]|nr:amidase signature enzyme [Butyriboletus roseoflavus]